MKSLGFTSASRNRSDTGKRVREARFERRSSLPASAACVVANGIRETLTALLGAPITLRLFEPVIPDPRAWNAIALNAMMYRVRGSVADAAIVLRAPDAIAFASAVFGEPAASDARALSPIERDVVDRAAHAIAANLIAVCGAREGRVVERVSAIDGFVTFFEMSMEGPVEARVGIALSRDPTPEPRGGLELAHLADVRVRAVAAIDLGSARAAAIGGIAVGAILPIRSDDLRRCTLAIAGRRLARGICGVRNGRYAIAANAIRQTR
jgi:hypothetical protein